MRYDSNVFSYEGDYQVGAATLAAGINDVVIAPFPVDPNLLRIAITDNLDNSPIASGELVRLTFNRPAGSPQVSFTFDTNQTVFAPSILPDGSISRADEEVTFGAGHPDEPVIVN